MVQDGKASTVTDIMIRHAGDISHADEVAKVIVEAAMNSGK